MKRFFLWRILFNKPKAGELYTHADLYKNPFNKTPPVKVLGVDGGWVAYDYGNGHTGWFTESCSVLSFNACYIKLDDQDDDQDDE